MGLTGHMDWMMNHFEALVLQIVPLLVAIVVLAAVHSPAQVVAHHRCIVVSIVSIAVDLDLCSQVTQRMEQTVIVKRFPSLAP